MRYELIETTDAKTSGAPFVGREKELRALGSHWEEAKRGMGHVMLITGEAGIGKTSLVKRFIENIGSEVPAFYSLPRPKTPFHPFREIIPNLAEAARRKGERIRQVWELLEEQVRVPGQALPIRPGQMPDNKFRQIINLRELFVETARGVFPHIVVIDNLDEADSSTRALFQAFEEMPEGTPLLLIGVARSPETIGQKSSAMRTFELELEPVSVEEIHEMLESRLQSPVSKDLVQKVNHHTAGNPLRITEFLHYARETHGIFKDSETGEWNLSETVRETWKGPESLMEGFSDEEISILAAAAEVSESDFSLAELVAAIGIDLETAFMAMKKATEREIVERLPGRNAFRFTHEHYRGLYAQKLSPEKLSALHHNIAEIIEKDPDPSPYLLAYHFARTNNSDKALHYSMAAGQDAMADDAVEHAHEFFTSALKFLQPADEFTDTQVELLENLGDCLAALLNFPAANESYAEALEAAPSSEIIRARLRRKRAAAFLNFGEAKASTDEALSGLQALGENLQSGTFSVPVSIAFHILIIVLIPFKVLKLLSRKGSETSRNRTKEILALFAVMEKAFFFIDHRRGILVHLKALLLTLRAGEAEDRVRAFSNHGFVCASIGFHGRAKKFLSRASKYAEKCTSTYWFAYSQWLSAAAAHARGDFTKALDQAAKALQEFKSLHSPFEHAIVEVEFFKNHFSLGNMFQAREHAHNYLEISRLVRDVRGEAGALRMLGRVHTVLGEFSSAEAMFDASLVLSRSAQQPILEAALLRDITLYHLAKGQPERARTEFENCLKTIRENDLLVSLFPDIYLCAAETELILAEQAKSSQFSKERVKAAETYLKKASNFKATTQGDMQCVLFRLNARLCLAREKPGKALRWYLKSKAQAIKIDQHLELAATNLEMSKYAEALGIADESEEIYNQGIGILKKLGISPDLFRPGFTSPERVFNEAVIEEDALIQSMRSTDSFSKAGTHAELYEKLAAEAIKICSANRGAIYLPDGNGEAASPAFSTDPDGMWTISKARYAELVQPALSEGSPIIVEDILTFPVLVTGTVSAVIYLEGFGPSRKISKSALHTLEAVAQNAGMAIRMVRALEGLKEAVGEGAEKRVSLSLSQAATGKSSPVSGMVGESREIKEVYHLIEKAEASNASVFITGETGTGKELVARAIHEVSPRRSGPFIPINVGALPETLLESELFGHVKGAFTGATEDKKGLFQAANNGTLFLDEVEAMPQSLQTKLLRVLEEHTVRPVGSTKMIPVDVRIVAASNEPMDGLVDTGVFRSDLYYRLAVFPIHVPPLRDRRSDIPILIAHLIKSISDQMGKAIPPLLTPQAIDALSLYDFPGNIRELRNELERAILLAKGGVIGLDSFSKKVQNASAMEIPGAEAKSGPVEFNLKKAMKTVEKKLITEALARSDGNKSQAAKLLGISRQALSKKTQRKSKG